MSSEEREVDLAAKQRPSRRGVSMFIESTTYRSIILTFLAFAAFESSYVYTGIRTSSQINRTTVHYPLSQTYSNRAATAKILLEPISNVHEFIRMDAALERHAVARDWSDIIEVNKTVQLLNQGRVVREYGGGISRENYSFLKGQNISNTFNILDIPTSDFDSLNISIVFETDFFFCKGFQFTYSFADPKASVSEFFHKSIRLFLAGCSLYAFVTFLVCLNGGVCSDVQYLAIVLGCAATLATNPIGALMPGSFVDMISPVVMAGFLAVFRVFVLFLVDTIVRKDEKPATRWFAVYLPFCVAFLVTEAYVGMNKGLVGFSSRLLVAFHIVYGIVVLILMGFAYASAIETQRFMLTGFGVFIIAALAMSMVTEVFLRLHGPSVYISMPSLLYQSTHIFSAIAFLFFQHSTTAGYSAIDKQGYPADNLTLDFRDVPDEEEDSDDENSEEEED